MAATASSATASVAGDRRSLTPCRVPVFLLSRPRASAGGTSGAVQSLRPADCSLELHLWADTSLREAADLLWAHADSGHPAAAAHMPAAAALSLGLVYPDRQGQNALKRLGCVHRNHRGGQDGITLGGADFQPGDCLLAERVHSRAVPPTTRTGERPGAKHNVNPLAQA